jgi:outer membrane receptor protein involved in Fe transport
MPWRVLEGNSSMQITSDWTYQFEFIVVGDATKPNVFNNCVGAFGPTCGEPNPRLKGTTNFQWRNGDLTVNLRWRFIGDVTDDRYLLPHRNGTTPVPLNAITHPIIDDTHYIDLSAAYNVTDNLEVIAGINNLFDLDPPVLGNGASLGYGNTFPSTYDAFGRTFFLNLTAKTD